MNGLKRRHFMTGIGTTAMAAALPRPRRLPRRMEPRPTCWPHWRRGRSRRTATVAPIGVQIIGGYLDDRTSIAFAGMIEAASGGFVPPPGL